MTSFSLGQRFSKVLVEDLKRTQLVQYAGASGDFNPLHTDDVHAREIAEFPGVFGHGMLTMAMTGTLLTDVVGMDALVPVERPRFLMVAIGAAGEIGIGLVDEIAGAVEPRHPHHRRRRIGDAAEPRLALSQAAFGDTMLGDVVDDDDEAGDAP